MSKTVTPEEEAKALELARQGGLMMAEDTSKYYD